MRTVIAALAGAMLMIVSYAIWIGLTAKKKKFSEACSRCGRLDSVHCDACEIGIELKG